VALSVPEPVVALGELGLDEVESGVVEDTFSNRQALRRAGYYWEMLTEEDEQRGTVALARLRVLNSEETRRNVADRRERRYECLEDQDNEWSEYLPPHQLLADAPVPTWVKRSGRSWMGALEQGQDPEELGLWIPTRCRYILGDGSRCWQWAGSSAISRDEGKCRSHLTVSQIVARETFTKNVRDRLAQASGAAVDRLEALLDAEAESVRLRAATEILDRVGVRAGTEVTAEVTVTHVDATALVRERLERLREAQTTRPLTVEGEVVE
jgi:hypothetical protein